MKAPKYDDQFTATDAVQCMVCGCITTDQDLHTSFHASLARMLGLEMED